MQIAVLPHITGLGFAVAGSTLALMAAAKNGPRWKKLFNRRGQDKMAMAVLTDPALRGGDWQRAAKIFENEGRYREAARLYQENGQNYEAARLMRRASEDRRGEIARAVAALEETRALLPLLRRGPRLHHRPRLRQVAFDRLGRLGVADLWLRSEGSREGGP